MSSLGVPWIGGAHLGTLMPLGSNGSWAGNHVASPRALRLSRYNDGRPGRSVPGEACQKGQEEGPGRLVVWPGTSLPLCPTEKAGVSRPAAIRWRARLPPTPLSSKGIRPAHTPLPTPHCPTRLQRGDWSAHTLLPHPPPAPCSPRPTPRSRAGIQPGSPGLPDLRDPEQNRSRRGHRPNQQERRPRTRGH